MAKKNQAQKPSRVNLNKEKLNNIGDSAESYDKLRKAMEIPPKKKDK